MQASTVFEARTLFHLGVFESTIYHDALLQDPKGEQMYPVFGNLFRLRVDETFVREERRAKRRKRPNPCGTALASSPEFPLASKSIIPKRLLDHARRSWASAEQ